MMDVSTAPGLSMMDVSTAAPSSMPTVSSRLLVVDDHTEVVAAIKDYFTALEYTVDTAYDGPSALEKSQQATYDVILLDIVMPQIDGLTICRRIKTDPKTADTGIIVLTAVDKLDARLEALRNGADDYISKPFSMKELELRVGLQARATSHRRAIQHALHREQRKTESLEMVAEMARQVTTLADGDTHALCTTAAQSLFDRFGYEFISVLLIDLDKNELILSGCAGPFAATAEIGYRRPLGPGIVGHVCRTGESYLCNDTSNDPYWTESPLDAERWSQLRSELCVPIKTAERVLGCLNIESAHLNAFDTGDRLMLEILAGHLAVGLTNAQLYRATVEQTTELAVQSKILGALNSTRDIPTLFQSISSQISRVIPHHGLAVTQYIEERKMVRMLYTIQPEGDVQAGSEFPVKLMPYTQEVLKRNAPVYVNEIHPETDNPLDFRTRLFNEGFRSILLAPIHYQENMIGIFILMNRETNAFSDHEVYLIQQLTPHLALAVTQAEEYEALQRAYVELQEAQEGKIQAEREKAMLDTALQTGLTLSHEINNPLTAIIGFAELLAREYPNQSEYSTILEAAQRIADVVRRLRQLKRVQLKSYVADIPTQMIDLGLPPDQQKKEEN